MSQDREVEEDDSNNNNSMPATQLEKQSALQLMASQHKDSSNDQDLPVCHSQKRHWNSSQHKGNNNGTNEECS
jgi:hypothetical protein